MHELALATEVVSICAARAEGARVVRVRLEVGRLAAVLPDALRFCFDACANGTLVQGAALDIIETQGEELRVKDMEVD